MLVCTPSKLSGCGHQTVRPTTDPNIQLSNGKGGLGHGALGFETGYPFPILGNRGLQWIQTTKRNHPVIITRWWFQPIWKIWVKLEIFPKFRGENKQYLKPPPRLVEIWQDEDISNLLGSRLFFRRKQLPALRRIVRPLISEISSPKKNTKYLALLRLWPFWDA